MALGVGFSIPLSLVIAFGCCLPVVLDGDGSGEEQATDLVIALAGCQTGKRLFRRFIKYPFFIFSENEKTHKKNI